MDCPLTAQLVEAQRELGVRRRVFPKWIQDGYLREDQAAKRIALMEAIVATLEAAVAQDSPQQQLFA